VNLTCAEATFDADRIRILNTIAGQDLVAETLPDCDEYDMTNCRLRGLFALTFWHRAMAAERPVEKAACKQFNLLLRDMAIAISGDKWRKSVTMYLAGVDLSTPALVDLMLSSIPPNLLKLNLDLTGTGITDKDLRKIVEAFPKCLQTLALDMSGNEVSDAGVMKFVQFLHEDMKTINLGLARTKVSGGVLELTKSVALPKIRQWAVAPEHKQAAMIDAIKQPGEAQKMASQEEEWRASRENILALARRRMTEDVRKRLEADLAGSKAVATQRAAAMAAQLASPSGAGGARSRAGS